jgi:hypothetical protein
MSISSGPDAEKALGFNALRDRAPAWPENSLW